MSTETVNTCNHPVASTRASRPSRRTAVLFAVVFLLLGFLPATLTFALNHNAAHDIGLTQIPVPAWIFVAVWLVIYPCMGIAAWRLWGYRIGDEVCVPMAVLITGFISTTAFWLTDSLRTTAVLDGMGVLLASTTVWVVSRYSRGAAYWLIPWVAWMPVTLSIKIAVLSGLLT
jgi:tryptophan-rich sensory protein